MENKQIEELAKEAYPIKESRNELQRTIAKAQQYGFIAGYQSAMKSKSFISFINEAELSQRDKNFVKGIYYAFIATQT